MEWIVYSLLTLSVLLVGVAWWIGSVGAQLRHYRTPEFAGREVYLLLTSPLTFVTLHAVGLVIVLSMGILLAYVGNFSGWLLMLIAIGAGIVVAELTQHAKLEIASWVGFLIYFFVGGWQVFAVLSGVYILAILLLLGALILRGTWLPRDHLRIE